MRPNSNAAAVDASPLSFKNPVPDRCTAPGEPLPVEEHPSGQDQAQGQPSPGRGPSLVAGRPRGSAGRRNSPPAPCALLTSSWRCDALRTATSSGRLRTPTPPTGRSRSGGTRQLYPAIARSLGPRCFHANLDSRRAPPPASSSPPPRPHATLTLTPPRRRPSATSSSSSRRAPSLARARLAACSSPHRAARDTLARHAAQLASCTASSARPRPHPPAYACRRPVPSPRQWERLMLNPARLYPTARLQIVRDLFFREWQARAHRPPPPHRSCSRGLGR